MLLCLALWHLVCYNFGLPSASGSAANPCPLLNKGLAAGATYSAKTLSGERLTVTDVNYKLCTGYDVLWPETRGVYVAWKRN